MDTIEFRLSALVYPVDPNNCALAYIFINGKDLLDTIYEFEKREGLKVISHVPLAVAELYKNLSEGNKAHAVPIFCYDGDATFFVNIEIGAERVVWKDFVLSHASAKKNFGEFVFDKAQYFREVEKLKRWSEDDSLSVEYGGIEGGEIKLVVKKGAQAFNFYFDELLDDPLPDLVEFVNAVSGGEDYFDINLMRDDAHVAFKLSIKPWTNGKVSFYVELVGEGLTFCEWLRRDDLAAMFKRIFDALLNDKYFPYSYPCYDYIHEEDELYDELINKAKNYPNWSFGDVLNHAAATGQLKLSPRYEKYLEHYKKMLTDYVIPDKWFD